MNKIFLSLLLIGSCSFKKTNQTLLGHEELYSMPNKTTLSKLSKDEQRIVIASTNDTHGILTAKKIEFTDKHNDKKQEILVGGKNTISEYFKILHETYGDLLLVDSGDIFSNSSDTKEVIKFYTENKYDAITVGLRDFNIQVPTRIGSNTKLFQEVAKSSQVPFLLSNLYELKTARQIDWPGTRSHLIKEINGIKVGVIGLIPDDIVTQTPVQNRVGLYIENTLQTSLKQARLLRSLGVDIIVALTHQNLDCSTKLSQELKLPPMKVNFDPQKTSVCDLHSPLGEYIERLPHGLIDVVIAGRNEFKIANIVNGTIIMASMSDGRGFSLSEIVFNKVTKKINFKRTMIHQPIYFCQEFFKETNDCFTEDESVSHSQRTSAKFMGKTITPDLDLLSESHSKKRPFETLKKLSDLNADIAYFPKKSGETQLILIPLTGREIASIMEEDFNSQQKNNWIPTPFLIKNEELHLKVLNKDIELDKTYTILTDLESVQFQKRLIHKIAHEKTVVLMNESWKSYRFQDELNSFVSAPER